MPTILGAGDSDTGYEIDNGLVFNGVNQWMTHTRGTATDEKLFTFSAWIKLGQAGILENGTIFGAGDDGNGYTGDMFALQTNGLIKQGDHDDSTDNHNVRTSALLRDPAAWYHVVVAADSTQGTSSNRIKIYVNGTQQTDLAASTYPSQNITFDCNTNGQVLNIGRSQNGENHVYWDGYMAEINFIDGQQLDPSYFAENNDNGIWVPKLYSGTYGNNGFFLEFQQTGTSQNSSGIGADTSGNDHHFAPTQLGSIDITSDTCTNNWCTMSNLYSDKQQGGAITFSQGLTEITTSYVDADYQRYPQAMSSMAVTKGKWYFEMKPSSGSDFNIGVFSPEDFASDSSTNPYGGYAATGVIYTEAGEVRQNDSTDSGHASYGTSDIVGCALDMDNNAVYFHKNNTYINSGNATSGASKTGAFTLPTTGENGTPVTLYGFVMGEEGASGTGTMLANFGQPPYTPSSIENDANGFGNFEYAPPSGYFALCTKNLAEFG